jgi:hypothetical protein
MKILSFILSFIFFLLTTAVTVCAQQSPPSEHLKVRQVIHTVFEAFSEANIEKMEQAATDDVNILEHGEVWTLDSIRHYFKRPRPADFKRINTLEFFQTEVSKEMAFVSYHNTAAIRTNGKDRSVKWLESAVLVKEEGLWKVKMLHSTRIQR